MTSERTSEGSLNLGLYGRHTRQAVFSLVRLADGRPPTFSVRTIAGEKLRPFRKGPDLIGYRIPANGEISLHW